MFDLGFIGAGNMASALVSSLISSKLYAADKIALSDPYKENLIKLNNKYGVAICDNNDELVNNSKTVILAVKPQVAKEVLTSLKSENSPLFISIVLGISTGKLESYLPQGSKVVRVMPNTPALVHMGSSVYSMGKNCSDDDKLTTEKILSGVGSVTEIEEKNMIAVTAISGCGPAYFYLILEAMSDAGVRLGLSRDFALRLAAETAAGAAQMVLQTKTHPAALKDQVTSPAGATIEAIYEFEKCGLRGALMQGIFAAAEVSSEHGKK